MLANYLPKFIADIEEVYQIMQSLQNNVDSITINIEDILKDFFINDATLEGVKRYEGMFNITPKLTESLEERKLKILSIYNETPPYTYKKLILILNAICGEENYRIFLQYTNLVLKLRIGLDKKDLQNRIFDIVDKIIPLNIFFNLKLDYNIWQDVLYNKWNDLNKFSWQDVLENTQIRIS